MQPSPATRPPPNLPEPGAPPIGGGTYQASRVESLSAISRDEWNRCFPGSLEDYDYCLAVERANIPGFTLCYYTLSDGETLLCAFPAFFTLYDLSTTADGRIKNLLERIRNIATLKLACIGSFATETALIALHPDGTTEQKCAWFAQLLEFFKTDAAKNGTKLLAFKDINAENKALFDALLTAKKFTRAAGMPTAVSPITFKTIEEYLNSLSANTRKDMRRKLKKQSELRIEYTRDIAAHMGDIYAMYLETKGRSDLQFEELTREYFEGVAKSSHGLCSLYFQGEKLVGCNLMLAGHGYLLDKFFCMRSMEGQDLNLYFLSWFANLQYCIDKGYHAYQSGQAGYETKLRLKSTLQENWMYFHHRNAIVNVILKLASPLLAFDIPQSQ